MESFAYLSQSLLNHSIKTCGCSVGTTLCTLVKNRNGIAVDWYCVVLNFD